MTAQRLLSAVPLAAVARAAALPAVTLLIILFMVVPLPALMLDAAFIFNIALSLGVLMVALNLRHPLDFSSFPTVLLFATLLRLALNVASTRVVLVDGHSGADAAGVVIEAFGHALIGGDWAVGLLVFAILMVINLIVITKGAGRVSEVAARFTLDALPGKQMAIDADLGAGLIGPDEARARRAAVSAEAEFHGAMDGASKFVKGDAIAGVLILAINLIGGLLVGMIGHAMGFTEAAEAYVMLAVGDALVAQVPALLLSIAAAAVVTRVGGQEDLAGQLAKQFASARAWWPVTAILALLAALPAMPQSVLLPATAATGALAWHLRRQEQARAALQQAEAAHIPTADPTRIDWSEVGDDAGIALDIGYALVPLVDPAGEAPLMSRLTGLRRQLSRELGFVLPHARVKDDLALAPNAYRISIGGAAVASGEVWPRDLMALNPGDAQPGLQGRPGTDPAFGLDALWIGVEQRADAVALGYTVVDAGTVIATHMGLLLRQRAHHLFGVDMARGWLDLLKQEAPQLVEALVPGAIALPSLAAVLRALLREGVPVREARALAEALALALIAQPGLSPAALTEAVRRQIGALLAQTVSPAPLPLGVLTLAPELEQLLADSLRLGGEADHLLEPALAQQIISAVEAELPAALARHPRLALVTTPQGRPVLARLLAPRCAELAVLSFLEVPDDRQLEVLAIAGATSPDPADPRAGIQPLLSESGETA